MFDELNGWCTEWWFLQSIRNKEKSTDLKTLEDYLGDVIENPAHTLEVDGSAFARCVSNLDFIRLTTSNIISKFLWK